MDWSLYYPAAATPGADSNLEADEIKFADIGCGYGGLLITLSEMFPEKKSIGMEIRVKVSDYVQDRIKALRAQNPKKFNNIACIRSNAMKYLPNFFRKGQVNFVTSFFLNNFRLTWSLDYLKLVYSLNILNQFQSVTLSYMNS